MDHLANYRQLVAKVDGLCSFIEQEFAASIACRPGCDRCCRHLTLFPVEAWALAKAATALPEATRSRIRQRAQAGTDLSCPLIEEGRCLLYANRPIICRTHGLPLLMTEGCNQRIDFCPDNFKDLDSLPGKAVIRLDLLNEALAAINGHFLACADTGVPAGEERRSIGEALLLNTITPEPVEEP